MPVAMPIVVATGWALVGVGGSRSLGVAAPDTDVALLFTLYSYPIQCLLRFCPISWNYDYSDILSPLVLTASR
jgi:hypothetical protein